jgi:hypothetical protein
MANQLPRSGGSKDKDDDSWGKLASDLFGIQFGGASDDDDFDLTDDEPTPQAPASPAASILEATPASRPVVEEEPDLSFPEDDEVAPAAAVEVVTNSVAIEAAADEEEPEAPRDPRDESEKDIWDLLESWNWDEPNRESSRAASGESRSSGSSGRRSEGEKPAGGRREDRGSRRDSSRSERPRRSSETELSEAPREARPRREDRPRRSDRAERGGDSSPPRTERPARTEPVADEFSLGIDEPVRPAAAERTAPPPPPRQRPAARVEADDFEGDLFAESTQVEGAPESGGTADETEGNGEPRRRRRRRRRGSRDRVRQDDAPVTDDVDESVESSDAADDVNEPEEPVTAESDDEGDSEPRRRRRRRRPRRRGEESPVRTEAASPAQDVEESDDDESEAGFAESEGDDDEEVPVAVSYEGIPSWEEAISYLQRRPRDPRQRDSSPRGRGNHRR